MLALNTSQGSDAGVKLLVQGTWCARSIFFMTRNAEIRKKRRMSNIKETNSAFLNGGKTQGSHKGQEQDVFVC